MQATYNLAIYDGNLEARRRTATFDPVNNTRYVFVDLDKTWRDFSEHFRRASP